MPHHGLAVGQLLHAEVVEPHLGHHELSFRFLVLRALFGIGMGGEWGVGASLVMEKVEPGKRGAVSGLLQQGYAAGYLLAALAYFTFFPHWGWRPLFFLGGLPALLALFIRVRVKESEVWRKTRHPDWRTLLRSASPLYAVERGLKDYSDSPSLRSGEGAGG